MNLPKAVLFDNDGVLVASERLHWRAWQILLPELGLPYREALIQNAVGCTSPQILAQILDLERPGWSPADWDLEAAAQRKNHYYLEIAARELEPYPGVREGLAWLRAAGVRCAVVSNAKGTELARALDGVGLLPHFDAVISRDDARSPKPHPSAYLRACEKLGVSPSQAIAVEDSPPGLEAALRAGVPAVAVMSNFAREVLASPVPAEPNLRPIAVLESMAEFFGWLKARS